MDGSVSGMYRYLRGDPDHLDGRLTAVARLSEPPPHDHPAASMVRGGLLCVQGNYRDQRTLSDFFRAEFGLTMEKGIEEVIEQAREHGGLEGALDPEQVRERLRRMGDAEFLPIPAKVVHLEGLEQAAALEGDVVLLGTFAEIQFAQMAVNAFPILYQARYREQERAALGEQIESMLEKLGLSEPGEADTEVEPTLETFRGDLEAHLLREILPGMFYAPESSWEAAAAEKRFRTFMAPHLYPADVERMVDLVPHVRHGEADALRHLELLVRKAVALQREDWKSLESIRGELGET
jgi:hypothetical protein